MLQQIFYYKTIPSPVGPLKLLASGNGLCAVLFDNGKHNKLMVNGEMVERAGHPVLLRAEAQLSDYFAGKRKNFDLPLDMRGSVFQIKSWRELQKIPYGKTISYGEQAARIGDVKKARAVGMENGRNPLSIVVPCHRVIGASGSLTGFGGGLPTKKFLLDLENSDA